MGAKKQEAVFLNCLYLIWRIRSIDSFSLFEERRVKITHLMAHGNELDRRNNRTIMPQQLIDDQIQALQSPDTRKAT